MTIANSFCNYLAKHSSAASVEASHASMARLRTGPHRYPPSAPVWRMTRWHGISHANSLLPTAEPTARAAEGAPIAAASWP